MHKSWSDASEVLAACCYILHRFFLFFSFFYFLFLFIFNFFACERLADDISAGRSGLPKTFQLAGSSI